MPDLFMDTVNLPDNIFLGNAVGGQFLIGDGTIFGVVQKYTVCRDGKIKLT